MARFYEGDRVELRFDNTLRFQTTGAGVSVTGDLEMAGGPRFRVPENNTLTIHSSESLERVRITSTGDVGIGTTNPTASNVQASLITNDKVLAVGIVTANEYYGTFKG